MNVSTFVEKRLGACKTGAKAVIGGRAVTERGWKRAWMSCSDSRREQVLRALQGRFVWMNYPTTSRVEDSVMSSIKRLRGGTFQSSFNFFDLSALESAEETWDEVVLPALKRLKVFKPKKVKL